MHPDTQLTDVINLYSESTGPIAVVDGNNKLLGVIVRGAIIAALSKGYKPEDNGSADQTTTEEKVE